MSKQSRLLVVDASVMRGSGAQDGHSATCTRLLNDIMNICHRTAITTQIKAEWDKHQSVEAIKWRARMNGKKKLVPVAHDESLVRTDIEQKVPSGHSAQKQALLKDAHLLAAAMATDRLLLTADTKLKALCEKHHIDQNIEWLTITAADPQPVRQALFDRLKDLASTRPNPPLPRKQ